MSHEVIIGLGVVAYVVSVLFVLGTGQWMGRQQGREEEAIRRRVATRR